MIILLIFFTACNSLVVGEVDQTPEPQNNDEEIDLAEIIELEEDRNSMRVLWNIADYFKSDNFNGDEADAKARIFEPLDVTETQIIFSDKMCTDVVFVEESVFLSEFLPNYWDLTPQTLGVEDVNEATVVRTNCSLFGFSEFLRLSDGRLIVPFNDVFYLFNPTVVH